MTTLHHKVLAGFSAMIFSCLWNQSALAQLAQATVELANVSESQSSSVVRLPGTVISTRDAEISAELDGRLTWVAEIGDRLQEGEPVAVIDDHLLQLELRRNKAEIARIEADIDYNRRQIGRLQQLANQNNMAHSELDAAESRMKMLTQDLRIAEVSRDRTLFDIDRTRVSAPFSGIVVSRSMNTGEYTETGSALLRLVDTQSLEVTVSAPMRVARYNQPGTQVQIEAEDNIILTAIRGVVPVGDPRSRMMELRLQLQAGSWFIGEAVTVDLADGQAQNSLMVPRDALVLRGEQTFIYSVSSDNKATKIPVTTGAGHGSIIAVQGNLAVGDPVIIRGAERLSDGQEVKVIQQHLAAH